MSNQHAVATQQNKSQSEGNNIRKQEKESKVITLSFRYNGRFYMSNLTDLVKSIEKCFISIETLGLTVSDID